MRRDYVIMKGIFNVGSLVLPTVEPTEVGVVLSEKKFGLNRVYLWVHFETIGGANRGRGGQTIQMGLLHFWVPRSNIIEVTANRGSERRDRRLLYGP